MLVQFSVENFKSIREEQTLSMVASNYYEDFPENIIKLDTKGMKDVDLLKSAVIYGANASGKSNLMEAMYFVGWFIFNSATRLNQGDEIAVEPFLLSDKFKSEPSTFCLSLIIGSVRYEYGFSLNSRQIFEEWLIGYPETKPRIIFDRIYQNGEFKYKYSSKVKSKKYIEDKTRNNALFLSVGAQFNDPDITKIYQWFAKKFIPFSKIPDWVTASRIFTEESKLKTRILKFLQSADIGIIDLEVEKVSPDDIKADDDRPDEVADFPRKRIPVEGFLEPHFYHEAGAGANIRFNLNQESAGTVRYFELLGPWLYLLENGGCAYLDEIDRSLHPNLVRMLISLFHSKKWNKSNAQLVMTTHDATLLTGGLFRRDQIWITEKSREGATTLYPLSDYKVRQDESLQKGYLAGRYGGIPFLGSEIE